MKLQKKKVLCSQGCIENHHFRLYGILWFGFGCYEDIWTVRLGLRGEGEVRGGEESFKRARNNEGKSTVV